MSVLKAKDPQTGEFSAQYGVSVNEGYDAGKEAEWSAFWDVFQENGNRTDYRYAFNGIGWTDDTFRPKHDIKPTQCYYMFHLSRVTDLSALLTKCGVELDLSTLTGRCDQMFAYATKVTKIPKLDLQTAVYSNGVMNSMFNSCSNLHTIENIHLAEDGSTTFGSGTFAACSALENITFSGKIGQNGLDIHWSPLTKDSIMSIINALQKKTSGTWTVTLGENLAKLTNDEIAIATEKGWTLA